MNCIGSSVFIHVHECYSPITSNQHSWEAKIIWSINIFTSFIQFCLLEWSYTHAARACNGSMEYIGYVGIQGKTTEYSDSNPCTRTRKLLAKWENFAMKTASDALIKDNWMERANKINTHKNQEREKMLKLFEWTEWMCCCLYTRPNFMRCMEPNEITYKCESILSFRYFYGKCTLHLTI